MRVPIYQVDAFASELFRGNPAAVCLLDTWMDDRRLQAIASENNLSETAFLVRAGTGYSIRWFTPVTEVALCGHATLAAAFVLFTCRKGAGTVIRFQTHQSGKLSVTRRGDLFEMDFPIRPVRRMPSSAGLIKALGVTPRETRGCKEALLVALDSERAVRECRPDFAELARLRRDVIITAQGMRSDFVSRCFAPHEGINEDPVTGSAHCVLVPYWAKALGRNELHAVQVSQRGGELFCVYTGDRVKIAGKAVLYMKGTLTL